MLLSIILAGLIQWQTLNKNIEVQNDTKLASYIGIRDYSDNGAYRNFSLGDSVFQEAQKAEEAREERSRTTYGGGQTKRGSVPYVYGYCTWYVAQKKNISTSFGDARYWPINSQEPQAGEVVITKESPRGHVALVEAVDGDNITLSEMNYAGWGKVSTRTINKNSWFIKGYLII